MAITNASRLADFGSGIGTAGAVLQIDNSAKEIGIGTTNPNATLTVGNIGASGTSIYVHGDGRIVGVLTATKFSGGWDGALSITDSTASTSSSTGALIVSGGVGIAKSLFVGEGISVGGTITYDDVTNIDSVGIVTAGKGFRATTGGLIVTAGVSTFGAQVSIADSIVHTGDTNTAIRFPSADTITAETAGSERLRIDSAGRLLVGTTSSSKNATIVAQGNSDSATSSAELYIQRGQSSPVDGATFGTIIFGDSGGGQGATIVSQRDGGTWSGSSKPGRLIFGTTADGATATSERMRITSTGISLFKAGLAEKINVKTQLTSANACAITDGNVILTTGNEPGNTYPNITGVHSVLSSGEGFSVTIALKVNGSGTINSFQIDGVAQTIEWGGGSAPSAGSAGYDVFTFSAFKTGSGTTNYVVFGAATNYD